MAKKRKGDKVDGWVNLNKPVGLTSTQALGKVRRYLNAQKAGHAGTLDPLASGILPIALGEATKTIPFAQDSNKTYEFTVTWGEQRNTDDSEGEVIVTSDIRPTPEAIKAALPKYTGFIQQTPPKFSAIKIDGARAYDLARSGEDVELQPREVYIESLELLASRPDEADFVMECGKGTYVRALARDIAIDLNTCGYISALKRTKVGPFTMESAISLDNLEELGNIAALDRALLPLMTVLDDIPALAVKEDEAARLRNGQTLALISRPDFERLSQAGLGNKDEAMIAVATLQGKPLALIEAHGATIQPVKVFNI